MNNLKFEPLNCSHASPSKDHSRSSQTEGEGLLKQPVFISDRGGVVRQGEGGGEPSGWQRIDCNRNSVINRRVIGNAQSLG